MKKKIVVIGLILITNIISVAITFLVMNERILSYEDYQLINLVGKEQYSHWTEYYYTFEKTYKFDGYPDYVLKGTDHKIIYKP